MHGSHLIKAYSRTQSNIALSNGEAEYYALVSTASEALGIVAMTEDFGDRTEAYLYADASAAIGVANREGLGRIRHLDTQVALAKTCSPEASARFGKGASHRETIGPYDKARGSKLLGEHVRSMGGECVAGRAELAPQIVQEVEDVVDFVDDSPSRPMTASVSEQSAIHKIHCAIESEVCLPPGVWLIA